MQNTKPRQVDKVLKRLRRGPLTQMEALTELGVMRLAPRILELRAEGLDISTTEIEVPTRDGETARVAQYHLAECKHAWEEQPDGWATVRCPTCGHVTLKTAMEKAA